MQTKYNIVKIHFASKKTLQLLSDSQKSKRSVEGIAYFVFNDSWKKCLRQIPFLISGEYRPNDPNMMLAKTGKGTHCWQKIGQERKKIFPNVSENKQTYSLQPTQIRQINQKALTEWNTILTLDKWLSGSNSSGAETNFKATPYLTNKPDQPELIFINCFKKSKGKEGSKKTSQFTCWKQLERNAISFADFLQKNPSFKQIFNFYNDGLILPNSDEKEMKKEKQKVWEKIAVIQKIKELEMIMENYINKSKQNILSFQNKENAYSQPQKNEEEKKLICKLRNIFSTTLKIEQKLNKINNSYVVNDDIYTKNNLEAAHIYPVHKASAKRDFEAISNHQNGLLISPNLHKIYDEGVFYFDIKGKIIFKNENDQKLKKMQIKEALLNSKRQKYLKKYHQYYQDTN